MLVSEPKFYSWGRCTIALTNMHSDPSSGWCFNLHYSIYVEPLFRILGCNVDPLGCSVDPLFRILGCNFLLVEHNRTPKMLIS